MPFGSFKQVSSVVKTYQLFYEESEVIQPQPIAIEDYFRQDLDLVQTEGAIDPSEYAICETIIYPILKQVWKVYRQFFLLWSHPSLSADDQLSGIPDYVLAGRSPLGRVVFDVPYCLIVEAKQNDFEGGWSQCMAAMLAAQKLNGAIASDPLSEPMTGEESVVFGIVSNGEHWEFGRLQGRQFAKNRRIYSLQDLDELMAAVNATFAACQAQLAHADRTKR